MRGVLYIVIKAVLLLLAVSLVYVVPRILAWRVVADSIDKAKTGRRIALGGAITCLIAVILWPVLFCIHLLIEAPRCASWAGKLGLLLNVIWMWYYLANTLLLIGLVLFVLTLTSGSIRGIRCAHGIVVIGMVIGWVCIGLRGLFMLASLVLPIEVVKVAMLALMWSGFRAVYDQRGDES